MQNNISVWFGSEDSLMRLIRAESYLLDPAALSEVIGAKLQASSVDDEDRYTDIGAHLIQKIGALGIVNLSGADLSDKYHWYNQYIGVVSYDEFRAALAELAEDSEIENILFVADTGGGSASGISEASDMIKQIDRDVKPVYAYTSKYTFSAGMWLASAARSHYANYMAQEGSVGVIIMLHSMHELYKKAGYQVEVVRAGKYKALGNPAEPITDEVRAMAQEKADKNYEFFLNEMSANRPALSKATKDIWAEGKTFFSDEAVDVGLIDEVKSFDDVVAELSKSYNNTDMSDTGRQGVYMSENTMTAELSANEEQEMGKGVKRVVSSEAELAAAMSGAEVESNEVVDTEQVDTEQVDTGAELNEGVDTEVSDTDSVDTEVTLKDEQMGAGFAAEFAKQTKDLAKAELKVEQLEQQLDANKTQMSDLKAIAVLATQNLYIGLKQTPPAMDGLPVETIVAMHTKARELFSSSFSLGGPKSLSSVSSREEEPQTQNTYCDIIPPSGE